MLAEQTLLNTNKEVNERIKKQLVTLGKADIFKTSPRALAMLQYALGCWMETRTGSDKEALLIVYPSEPVGSTKARATLSRLRRILDTYYQNEGSNDPIEFRLPARGLAVEVFERSIADPPPGDKPFGISPPFQAILDAVPIPVFVKDENRVYRACNQAFARFLGRGRESILGRRPDGVALPAKYRVYDLMDQELLANPGHQIYHGEVDAAQEAIKQVLFHKGTIHLDDRTAGLVGCILDISPELEDGPLSRSIENARSIDANLDRIRRLGSTTAEGVVIHKDGIVLQVSDSAISLFGYVAREDVVGQHIRAFVTPETWSSVEQHVDNRSEAEYRAMGLRADGSGFSIRVAGARSPYGPIGARLAIIAAVP